MSHIETTQPHIQRDMHSKALLVTDRGQLLRARASRRGTHHVLQKHEEMTARFAAMSSRLDKVESLLHELVTHVATLADRVTMPCEAKQE